jgi:uncharacterized protein (UPF0248 family)
MIYDILVKLKQNKQLYSCSITVFHPGAVNNKRFIFGREIVDFNTSAIRFRGGETGYEEFTVPLEDVMSVESGGKTVFKRKPRIKRVYPR